MSNLKQKTFVLTLLLILLGLLGSPLLAQGDMTVKIGVMYPTTGNFTIFGEQAIQGLELYFDNNPIEGVTVEFVFADTAGDPQQALEQARRLVDQEGVDLLTGLINSAVSVPLAQFADENEVPLIISIAGARQPTLEDSSPYVFRTSMANGQQDGPLGWYMASEMGMTNAGLFAWDFLVGEERAGAFAEQFTSAGGTVTADQRPPLGTTDYGPFISQVDPGGVDVLYAFFAGPGAIAFMQQMTEFGLLPDLQVAASGYFSAGVLGAMGENAVGLIQATQWVPAVETEANANFLTLFEEQVDGEAGVYVEEGYLSAEVIGRAIEAVGGDMSDTQAFLDALSALSFESTAGPFSFDENGQAVRNVYITQVSMSDAGPTQEILDTIEAVGMTWSPDDMAEPMATEEP